MAACASRGDVLVAAVADEEYGSLGTTDLIRRVKVDGAIVTEPTALDVCLAHKGYLWIEVEVRGRAAHGSKFELGIDANMKMGHFLHRLSELERDLRARPPHPLVGPPSLHAAMLKGGAGLSTYAPSSTVQIERRTVPGETEEQAVAEIQAIVDSLAASDADFAATVRPFFVRDPFEVAPGAADRARGGCRRGESPRPSAGPHRRYPLDGCGAAAGRRSRDRSLRRERGGRPFRCGMGGPRLGHEAGRNPGRGREGLLPLKELSPRHVRGGFHADPLHHSRFLSGERADFEIGEDIAVESADETRRENGLFARMNARHAQKTAAADSPDAKRRIAVIGTQPAMHHETLAGEIGVGFARRRRRAGRTRTIG